MLGRTIQIKMVKEQIPPKYERYQVESPKKPEEKPEAIASELIQTTMGCVVVGYTICKSVDFFFRMAEHAIVNR